MGKRGHQVPSPPGHPLTRLCPRSADAVSPRRLPSSSRGAGQRPGAGDLVRGRWRWQPVASVRVTLGTRVQSLAGEGGPDRLQSAHGRCPAHPALGVLREGGLLWDPP